MMKEKREFIRERGVHGGELEGGDWNKTEKKKRRRTTKEADRYIDLVVYISCKHREQRERMMYMYFSAIL